MRKSIVIAMAMAMLAVAGTAMAATTSVEVAATINSTCAITSTPSVNFGTFDAGTLTTDITQSGVVEYWCTKGTTATLSSNRGIHYDGTSNRMKHSTAPEYIPYTLTLTASSLSGGGKNVARELFIRGFIANSDYVNALVGNYSDTVELRITP